MSSAGGEHFQTGATALLHALRAAAAPQGVTRPPSALLVRHGISVTISTAVGVGNPTGTQRKCHGLVAPPQAGIKGDPVAELGKRGDLHARRQAISQIRDQDAVSRYATRNRDYRTRTAWSIAAATAIPAM